MTVEGPTFQAELEAIPDDEIRYLVLWRFGTEVLRYIEGTGGERLGALWDVLPADTRMPHHPLAAHNSLVAALAPMLAQNQDLALLRPMGPLPPVGSHVPLPHALSPRDGPRLPRQHAPRLHQYPVRLAEIAGPPPRNA